MAASSCGTGSASRPAYRSAWTAATTASTPSPAATALDLASVVRGLELAGVTADRGTEDHVVGATYLAAIACRYLAGAESDQGAVIAGRSRMMLDALRAWLGLRASVHRWLRRALRATRHPVRPGALPVAARRRAARGCIALWGMLTSRWRLQPGVPRHRGPARRHHHALPRPERAPRRRPADGLQGHRLLRPATTTADPLVRRPLPARGARHGASTVPTPPPSRAAATTSSTRWPPRASPATCRARGS